MERIESVTPGAKEDLIAVQTLSYQHPETGDQIDEFYWDNTWDEGEGRFKWWGRSRDTAEPNKIQFNMTRKEVRAFLADFNNLNNNYWAHAACTYILSGPHGNLSEACVDITQIEDEDAGNEPRVHDAWGKWKHFADEATQVVAVYRFVWWTWRGTTTDTCADHL